MYYVKTRADNSGYANHRVICLVVIGSSFDIEQVFQVSNRKIEERYNVLLTHFPGLVSKLFTVFKFICVYWCQTHIVLCSSNLQSYTYF
jgi:hypothetical protein